MTTTHRSADRPRSGPRSRATSRPTSSGARSPPARAALPDRGGRVGQDGGHGRAHRVGARDPAVLPEPDPRPDVHEQGGRGAARSASICALDEIARRVRRGRHRPDLQRVRGRASCATTDCSSGSSPRPGLLSEAQQWQLVLSCLDDLPPFEALEIRSSYVVGSDARTWRSRSPTTWSGSADIDAAADRILSMQGADEKMVETAPKRKELVSCRRRLHHGEAAKAGRIDFGDQITKAVEVLEGHTTRSATRTGDGSRSCCSTSIRTRTSRSAACCRR